MVSAIPLHAGQNHLPLSLETATAIVVFGALVFGLVVFDAYRTYWG